MSNTLQKNLRNNTRTIGTWLSIGSPIIAELAAASGFDWLLFDLEHGCAAEAALIGNLQAVSGSSSVPVVRVGAPHPDLVMRVLDWGAKGVMVPHIESAAEAEACVQTMHYPPRGRRGFSRSVRAYRYGVSPVAVDSMEKPVLIVQIETLEGVRNARAIAAVDGVDMLFVGPADLSFDIHARPDENGARANYEDCLKSIVRAAREAGKSTGILIRDDNEIPALAAMGFQHLAIDSDLAILRNRYKQLLPAAKAAAKA